MSLKPRRGVNVGPSEPRSQCSDDEQIKQSVEHRGLAEIVFADLGSEQRKDRAVPIAITEHDQPGQRIGDAPADLTVALVGAGKHHGGALRGIAPRAHPLVHRLSDAHAVERGADLPGMDDHLRWGVWGVGDGVMVWAANQGDIARVHGPRVDAVVHDPRGAADSRGDGERRLVSDAQRPRRVHDGTQQKRPPSARPVEEAHECVHAISVDAGA